MGKGLPELPIKNYENGRVCGYKLPSAVSTLQNTASKAASLLKV